MRTQPHSASKGNQLVLNTQ